MAVASLEFLATPFCAPRQPWKGMECLKGEGLAEGGYHLYSFWETVMWLEWDFLGWGSSCLGVTSAQQRVSFIHQMIRIEFFLWSVGGLSGVNRCSLPPPLGKLTEWVASDAWLMARHTSADLFNCEPRKLKKNLISHGLPRNLLQPPGHRQVKHYLNRYLCLKVTGTNSGCLEPVKTRI